MRRLVLALLLLATPVEALEIADFGGLPDGSDTAPALNAAASAALAGPDRTIHFQAGSYIFLTPPTMLWGPVRLRGEGKLSTLLVRHYNGDFLAGAGIGLGFRDLTIWAPGGTSGGRGLHLIASNTLGAGGDHELVDIRITGHGTWAIPLYLDGAGRTLAPIGIRTVALRNVMLFNGTNWAAEWWNCVACEWFGGGAWQGYGSTEAIVVGGPLGQANWISADIDWSASSITGLRAR